MQIDQQKELSTQLPQSPSLQGWGRKTMMKLEIIKVCNQRMPESL
jgi:hypothetical protein